MRQNRGESVGPGADPRGQGQVRTICYAIMLPGRKSAFRAGFWPDCYRERTKIGPLRPAGGAISVLPRQQSGQNPARKADFRFGSAIA